MIIPKGYRYLSSDIKDVYLGICRILSDNGFSQNKSGDMVRGSTGCSFPVEYLINCKSVLDFQLEWKYA